MTDVAPLTIATAASPRNGNASTGAENGNSSVGAVVSSSEGATARPQSPMKANGSPKAEVDALPVAANGLPRNGTGAPKPAARILSSDDDEEDNLTWAERMRKKEPPATVVEKKVVKAEPGESPSTSKRTSASRPGSGGAKKKRKTYDSSDDEQYQEESDEEEYGSTKKKKPAKDAKPKAKAVKKEPRERTPEAPTSSKKAAATAAAAAKKAPKKEPASASASPQKGRKRKAEEEEEIWRWWEDEKSSDGVKWKTLEHKGPLFAPPHAPLPETVRFRYEGKVLRLSEKAEEVASFYAKMLDHEYTSKAVFNQNFFKDWRKTMTAAERETISDLAKCDFKELHAHFLAETEKRKAMSKEEKLKIKELKDREQKEYGYAWIDAHKQKIGNFRIEPPGLFRGRGDHPKMGRLKKRTRPEDVIINCSKKAVVPTPPPGHKWKEVRSDNKVTWLCAWTENVLGQNKYIMLNPSSKIKGEKDWEKFETARKLKDNVERIRSEYAAMFKVKEMRVRQLAVAIYFIDKLALRAGNEKDTDESADTVGCCSLRCEHIKLFEELADKKYVVDFDFLGKDSIRYQNSVAVEKVVFKNLKLFMENKEGGDDLFDRLDTSSLNAHLKSLMPGLSAKVFRTYNASFTLQEQLTKLTRAKDSVHEKILSYNRANREVALLCNHQRAVPKTHEKSMENLEGKIKEKKRELKDLKAELKTARGAAAKEKVEKRVQRTKEQLKKLKIQRTDKDENKQIALGTSKLNYLDPRISVAWCKKFSVPIEKIFNKTQREKFRWALDMATESFVF